MRATPDRIEWTFLTACMGGSNLHRPPSVATVEFETGFFFSGIFGRLKVVERGAFFEQANSSALSRPIILSLAATSVRERLGFWLRCQNQTIGIDKDCGGMCPGKWITCQKIRAMSPTRQALRALAPETTKTLLRCQHWAVLVAELETIHLLVEALEEPEKEAG
jgi:hypothetical protein